MRKSVLCDYRDGYLLLSGTISVKDTAIAGAMANNTKRKVIFQKCAPFTDAMSEINNT